MELFYSPLACSLASHITIREAGLDVARTKVTLSTKTTADGRDYYSIAPKGMVPALKLDDGQILTEGPAVVQFLADLAPGTGLAPAAGTLERVRLQEWLNYLSGELHKQVFAIMFDPAFPKEAKDHVAKVLPKKLSYVAERLGDGPWLLGETFTVADAYLITILNWTRSIKLDLSPWPALAAFVERAQARPSVAAALGAELAEARAA